MPRLGQPPSKGLGYKKPKKRAKVDVASSPLMVVETPDDPPVLGSKLQRAQQIKPQRIKSLATWMVGSKEQ